MFGLASVPSRRVRHFGMQFGDFSCLLFFRINEAYILPHLTMELGLTRCPGMVSCLSGVTIGFRGWG